MKKVITGACDATLRLAKDGRWNRMASLMSRHALRLLTVVTSNA